MAARLTPAARDALDLAALYARVPHLACKGLCHDACTTVPAGPAEVAAVRAAGGDLRSVPDRAAAVAWMRENYARGDADRDVCPSLSAFGRCRVYAARPMICRLWGTTARLACPHGCEPDDWLSDSETRWLLNAAIEIGTPHA